MTVSALAAPYEVNNIQLAFEANDPANFPAPVPEPATWGLMLASFAGLGVVMRRRRVPDQARSHGKLAAMD